MSTNGVSSLWFRRVLAVLAGALLALSFHKTNIAGLAWLGPGLILLAARGTRSFWFGYLAGFTHYLISLSWLLQIPVKFYPILGWIALGAYLAIYTGAWTWLVLRFDAPASNWSRRTLFALLAALAWVAMEMAIARVFTGFPWNPLGSSQQKLAPLIQIAAWTGVYGVAFLVVWFSVSLANAIGVVRAGPSSRPLWLQELALPMLAVAGAYAYGLSQIRAATPPARELRVALIQPSIPQTMIWNAADSEVRFAELVRLTEAALAHRPQLVIWPEAAMPRPVRADPEAQRAIVRLAMTNAAWFIVGSDDFERRGTNEVYFNSSFLVSPQGEFISTYRKRRLVIFGEYVPLLKYVPFVKYLTPITGGFTEGEEPVTFDLGDVKAKTSVLICFEDVFPHYAREHASEDVDFLVNITNDGWFGESAAHWQHAATAAFRSVENGRPLVRCANNGISCWIDRFGQWHQVGAPGSKEIYGAGFKIVDVPIAAQRARPFYNRHGDVFGWSCVAFTLIALGVRIGFPRRG